MLILSGLETTGQWGEGSVARQGGMQGKPRLAGRNFRDSLPFCRLGIAHNSLDKPDIEQGGHSPVPEWQ